MPKHLYTIPSGTELPDVTGLPEGYPFLLLTSDETAPGVLNVLQGTAFVVPAAGVATTPVVTATRTPAIFVAKIPAKPVADATAQDITASYAGVDAASFVVPAGLGGTTAPLGQLREITLTTDAPGVALSDTITLHVMVDKPPVGSPVEFAPTTGSWAITNVLPVQTGNVTYDATVTANQLPVGTLISATVHVGGAYANASDAYVLITLWLGEKEQTGAMLSEEGTPMREGLLNEREGLLAQPA